MAEETLKAGVGDPHRRLIFDPTINLGHVLTAASFLIVGTGGYVSLDVRFNHLERAQREEQTVRLSADQQLETRMMREMALHKAQMDQIQIRTADDIREIKSIVREGFRDLDGKLEKKTDKPGK